MSVIMTNNIPLPEKRERFNKAVLEGMGKLPHDWKASIYQPQETGFYVEVAIEGPESFAWTCRFTGPNEQESEYVTTTIRNGLLPYITKK